MTSDSGNNTPQNNDISSQIDLSAYRNAVRKDITVGIRLASMFLDHIIMCFLIMLPMIPFFVLSMRDAFNVTHEQVPIEPAFMLPGFIIGFSLYFNKDFFNGRSGAKRITKTQVLNYKTNAIASPIRCLIRNLSIVIWPLEVLITLFNPERRLGDYIAGTRVAIYQSDNHVKAPQVKDYLISFGLGAVFTLLIALPFNAFNKSIAGQAVNYVPESYQPKQSDELSSFLSYRLKDYSDSVSIRLYDQIDGDTLKYISLLCYTNNDDIMDDYVIYNKLEKMIIDTLDLKVQRHSFLLKGKIIRQVPGSIQIRYMDYNPRIKYAVNTGPGTDFINDSTKLLNAYYDNGQIESEAFYVHKKLHGSYKEWYKNGHLKTEINYIDGKREGLTITYYPNGQKKHEMLYQDNDFVRDVSKWDESGNELALEE